MQRPVINLGNSASVYFLKPIISHNANAPAEPNYSREKSTRFLIHSLDDIKVILFDEVVFCEADSNYTTIHLSNGNKVMVSKTLKDVEAILCHPQFFRIHASYIVNLNCVQRIFKHHRCSVELQDSITLEVSRSKRYQLMRKMEGL